MRPPGNPLHNRFRWKYCTSSDILQRQAGDELTVMLHQVDPGYGHDFARAHWVGEDELIADAGDCGPFARADFGHRFAGARIDKLNHNHGCDVGGRDRRMRSEASRLRPREEGICGGVLLT